MENNIQQVCCLTCTVPGFRQTVTNSLINDNNSDNNNDDKKNACECLQSQNQDLTAISGVEIQKLENNDLLWARRGPTALIECFLLYVVGKCRHRYLTKPCIKCT